MRKKKFRETIKQKAEIDKKLDEAEIVARTPFLPCEDYSKVAKALTNVLNDRVKVEKINNDIFLTVYSSGKDKIERIFNQFRNRQVLAALRKFLMKYSSEDQIIFHLHKQAAYNGIFSLSEPGESPGGEITVIIKVKNAKDVIMWLTRF